MTRVSHTSEGPLPGSRAVIVFLAFALTYFLSTLVRAVTATLAPVLSAELSLEAGDLGPLSGGYFLGFALTQLPLGKWLDRHGPRRVELAFLTVAVAACMAFALSHSFTGLLVSRVVVGMGLSACLMAPLTGYRRWMSPDVQLRANSWMLMTGSLGMLASTLPVQWLLPLIGWRGLFWTLAATLVLAMGVLWWLVPVWRHRSPVEPVGTGVAQPTGEAAATRYRDIWHHPYFRLLAPLGFLYYGGMIAVQTLWAGPWFVRVVGVSREASAGGLFAINLCMLTTFWTWGMVSPRLFRKGWTADRLMLRSLPFSFGILATIIVLGPAANWPWWAAFCVSCTSIALAQPAVAQVMPAAAAGRALSLFNLVLFVGIFSMQWLIGLLIDAFKWLGWPEPDAFRGAFAVFLFCSLVAYGVFWRQFGRWKNADPAKLQG